ncbi:peroxisome biogenesis factor 10 [Artemisia annua]|uniref:Peroxisome biogenesis factor 10 n=1 Tax=Artemisia annua TaxID=35608 RepID=A0A2U1M0B3_ARTAN|nr:peroxisome biogenesis factor 10 [Artemisia annua]
MAKPIAQASGMAAALPPDDDGDSVQMKLSYSSFAPFLLYLIDWMDYSCTDTIPTVIYPSLKQLDGHLIELKDVNDDKKTYCKDVGRDDECGICMYTSDKMALPNCGHSMCIGCFRDWNTRSKSCPFCRGSLKKVHSGDLWVLTSESDSVDLLTLAKENLRCFYLYIESLPFVVPDTHFLLHEEDIRTEIAKYLDGKSLVMLAATSKWFIQTMMHGSVWKFACLRDLQIFKRLTCPTFVHLTCVSDWMRIGAFCFTSSDSFLMENLICPEKLPKEETMQNMLNAHGSCYLRNIKTGVWIADLQLVRCLVCELNTSDGCISDFAHRNVEEVVTMIRNICIDRLYIGS